MQGELEGRGAGGAGGDQTVRPTLPVWIVGDCVGADSDGRLSIYTKSNLDLKIAIINGKRSRNKSENQDSDVLEESTFWAVCGPIFQKHCQNI